jgi:hypothetical protein
MVCTLLGYISDIKLSRLSFIATSLPPPPPPQKKTSRDSLLIPKRWTFRGDSFRSLWDQEHFLGLCRKPLCIIQELGYLHILQSMWASLLKHLGSFIYIKVLKMRVLFLYLYFDVG